LLKRFFDFGERDGVAPPTPTITPGSDCDRLRLTARKLVIESALSNSFGFAAPTDR
jgi:hypothetical protein